MMHSFLLIGQSNMAGRGFLDEAHPVDTSRIYTLRNGRWQTMFRPINPDRSFSGVSLAESFAECYAKKYGVDVGLICCADGGTSLEQWRPGGQLFDHAVFQARLAARSSKIVGVLWHQGEADCDDGLWSSYQQRFEPIMAALRAELGLENAPFILGGLGDFLKDFRPSGHITGMSLNYERVNEALERTAQENDMTGFVSPQGLGANPDNLHFNSQALYEFGIRYFQVFEALYRPRKDDVNDTSEDLARSELVRL